MILIIHTLILYILPVHLNGPQSVQFSHAKQNNRAYQIKFLFLDGIKLNNKVVDDLMLNYYLFVTPSFI